VRNREEEGIALLNIERNPLITIVFALISAVIIYYLIGLFKELNPLGFLVIMPAAVLSFQTLWFILNPFAIVYENKITIKQSILHHKDHYFIDLKKITEKDGKLYLTYNDGEVGKMKLFGIKNSHIVLLKNEADKFISLPAL